MEDSDGRVRAGPTGVRVLGPELDASAAADAAGVGLGDGCGAVAGDLGCRVDGGG
jgi:hypothetical protein